MVDIDNEEDGPILRIKDARAICHDNGLPLAFCYQTFSYTKEHPKFRLAFVMDKPMNRIKEVLEEKGIKQTWLAEKLGKSFCIVNSYVCNRRQPSLEVLFQIAEVLQMDVKDLIKSSNND